MKKFIFALAFTGMVGAASAASLTILSNAPGRYIEYTGEKDKSKHKKCKKDKSCCKEKTKACCKKSSTSASTSCKGGSKATEAGNTTEQKKTAE